MTVVSGARCFRRASWSSVPQPSSIGLAGVASRTGGRWPTRCHGPSVPRPGPWRCRRRRPPDRRRGSRAGRRQRHGHDGDGASLRHTVNIYSPAFRRNGICEAGKLSEARNINCRASPLGLVTPPTPSADMPYRRPPLPGSPCAAAPGAGRRARHRGRPRRARDAAPPLARIRRRRRLPGDVRAGRGHRLGVAREPAGPGAASGRTLPSDACSPASRWASRSSR